MVKWDRPRFISVGCSTRRREQLQVYGVSGAYRSGEDAVAAYYRLLLSPTAMSW